ncbi:MAG: prohibitin family protein [bacterium]|jgi:regulator of protease activity HflC (stomatin/prohibitin superfamily)
MKRIREWLGRQRRGLVAFLRRQAPYVVVVCLAAVFLFVYFFDRMVISIHSGELGVLWRRLGGTVVHTVYREGLHIILPINRMYIYNNRKQRISDSIDVLTVDGLTVHVEYSVRYFPNPDLLPLLHQKVGPDYVNVVVRPEVRSVIRTIFGQYKPEEIYTSQKAIQERISVLSKVRLEARFVSLDEVPIERISLPKTIADAIEAKLAQQQLDGEYVYRLAVAAKEAERKLIEAKGQQAYNETVSRSLNPMLLQWQGIQATEALAKSSNAKVVVIGGKDGLPLILGKE